MGFSLDKNHPNCAASGKRTYHTIIPGMATHASNNELFACFGVIGGFMQPQGHIQVKNIYLKTKKCRFFCCCCTEYFKINFLFQILSNMIDFGMAPQSALCHPRYFVKFSNSKASVTYLEEGTTEDVIKELKELGHNIVVISGFNRMMFGRGQIIQIQHDNQGNRVLWCGSDSRSDGCALGY